MEKEFTILIEYLDYLISDSKIDKEQKELLEKLNNVIFGLKPLNDVRNKVYANSTIKDTNDRLDSLLTKYMKQRESIESQLASALLNYGSDRLNFLDNAIESLNSIIQNRDVTIEEIIEQKLEYPERKRHELLKSCFENLVVKGHFTSFFGTTLVKRDCKTDDFVINQSNVERIYAILNNKEEFTKLEQAVRLHDEISICQEEKRKIDLILKHYNTITEVENLKKDISVLRYKIKLTGGSYEYEVNQLIEQKDFYSNVPFGKLIFQNRINNLSKKIWLYQKYQQYIESLYTKQINKELKKDSLESFLRRKNLYFLFSGEEPKWCLSSKDSLMAKQCSLGEQIQKKEESLQGVVSQLDETYRYLYFDDQLTCRNLILDLKDNQSKFISFYILLMLVYTEKLISSKPDMYKAPNQLIDSIVETYLEIQNNNISKLSEEHAKTFHLRRN